MILTCRISKRKACSPVCKMSEHLVPACIAYCQQERKLHGGDLDYEGWPLGYQSSGKGDLALDALVVLGHAEIFQGIPKFDRMF